MYLSNLKPKSNEKLSKRSGNYLSSNLKLLLELSFMSIALYWITYHLMISTLYFALFLLKYYFDQS